MKGPSSGAAAGFVLADFLARTSYGMARTPLLPLYAAFLGAGPELVGLAGAAATVTGLLLKLPVGTLSDEHGKRPFLLLGLCCFAFGPFLYLLAPGPASLVGVRFLHGGATAIYSPVSMAVIAALAGAHRGEYLAWLSNAKTAGALAGAALGGALLTLGGDASEPGFPDFRRAYLVCGAIGVAALAAGLGSTRGLVPPPPPAERKTLRQRLRKLGRGMKEILSDRKVVVVSSAEGMQNVTMGMLEQFLPLYAVLVAGLSPFEAGLVFGAQVATTFLSKPLLGRWSDRRGRRALILAGMLACALPFAALPWLSGLLPLALASMLFGLGEALVTSSSAALVADLCEERSLGAAMGAFGTIGDLGHALGPIAGGLLLGAFAAEGPGSPSPYRIAFGLVGAALAAATLVAARATRGGR